MQIASTAERGFSTFLLEMALDDARMRRHLAARLVEERTKKGFGDARRFPQPEMAREIGVSGRAYQGWEAEERLPNWRNLGLIADYLHTSAEDLLGCRVTEDDLPANDVLHPRVMAPADVAARLEGLATKVGTLTEEHVALQKRVAVLEESAAVRKRHPAAPKGR